jgi:hypothetical protein
MHVLENGLHIVIFIIFIIIPKKNGLDNLVLPKLFETPLEGTFNLAPA